MYLTYYDGNTGEYNVDGDPAMINYMTCVSELRDCPRNRQGVHEADMDTYKNANYFTAYIGTYCVMHETLDEEAGTTKEAEMTTIDPDSKPFDIFRNDVYDTLDLLTFQPVTKASFCNCITVETTDYSIVVRNTGISIPNLLIVGKGTYECTQQVDIGEFSVMKGSSEQYDYYQYSDNLIKAVKGTDITQYITLSAIT